MSKIFAEAGIRAAGNLLPPEEIDLYAEVLKGSICEERKALLVQLAEVALGEEITVIPATLYLEFARNGNRSHFEDACFRRRRMLLDLAFGEYVEKKGRFTEKLADLVWAIMEEATWMVPASRPNNSPYGAEYPLSAVFGNDRDFGVELFSASTGATLATVYYLLKDELDGISPVICKKLVYTLHHRLIKPYIQSNFWWMGDTGRKTNNWAPWISSNILTVASIVTKDPYVLGRVADRSIMNLDNWLKDYPADGGCDEGPSYWGAAGGALLDCLEILEIISDGRINVYSHPLVKSIGEYMVHVHINGRYFLNFADCNATITPSADHLYRYGVHTASASLQTLASELAVKVPATNRGRPNFSHAFRSVMNIFTEVPRMGTASAVETVSWMPGHQVFTARSLESTDEGVFLACKGGDNNESHNHNDLGNFVVYKNGKPVIVDAGVGRYTKQTFSADRYKLWFMQSGYHNLPSFGGVDQKNGVQYAASVLDISTEDKRVLYELSGAYPAEAGLLSYRRELKLADGTVTVTDTVDMDREQLIDFHLLTHREPREVDGGLELAEGMLLCYSPSLTCEVECFESEGLNARDAFDTDCFWRIHLKTTAKSGEFTVTIK